MNLNKTIVLIILLSLDCYTYSLLPISQFLRTRPSSSSSLIIKKRSETRRRVLISNNMSSEANNNIGSDSTKKNSSLPFNRPSISSVSSGIETKTKNKYNTVGKMRGGVVFLKTRMDLDSLVRFYTDRIGMTTWLEQPNISMLSHGNMILGFQAVDDAENAASAADLTGMYTFVYPSKEEVDDLYSKLRDIADGPPRTNDRYRIYQFFAVDPEGRKLEFQAFLHPVSIVTSSIWEK